LAYGYISTTVPLNPDTFVPELGESWSEPVFGSVLTTSPGDAGYATDEGTPVFFVGGGYTDDNLKGLAVLAVNVETGKIVKMWSSSPDSAVNTQTPGMNYSFASAVKPVDENNNGFVDKLYVGDLGGQMWRIGKFTDASNVQLPFPETEENINDWTASLLFTAGCGEGAGNCLDGADDNGNGFIDEPMKFFYPPSVTLERGYDLVLMVTGDRENACDPNTIDGVAAVKDDHTATTYIPADLVDVSDEATATVPYLDGGDNGWYLTLEPGEKVQATGIVFFKTFYFTTFRPSIPSDPGYDPCLPGGVGRLYAVNYKTGGSVLSFGGGSLTRSTFIGGGIPSRPVMIIPPKGMPKLYISVGSTDESDAASGGNFGAGVVAVNPLAPPINFHYLWWRELVD
jgi:type IV pilus assembly protein PilY1